MSSIGRNDPCPCGSGKKYKKCCMDASENNIFSGAFYERASKRKDDIIPIETVIDYGQPFTDNTFYQSNDVHAFSSARLIYSCLLNPYVEELANKAVRQLTDRGKEELNRIKNANETETLIEIMKQNPDMINHTPLIEELVKHKEKSVAAILRELKGPQNDSFVELAVRILHRIGINCSDEVLEIIRSGRNRTAYAISTLCILLGFYDNDNSEKLLWDYYHYMKQRYPNDTYSDGPLLGLIEIKERKREKASLN
ncbi:MAG: SEC-C metal-binding domain-containing protein [Thermodesulfovibrionales bacterium]|nr:SEC-C metal-binding domain-containing protein [Thermodesulfovibrionales bacterium]